MLYYGVPFLFYENDLFNPKYYASSMLAPSLGDLLLNSLVVVILLLYLVIYYYRSRLYLQLTHWPVWARWGLAVGCVVPLQQEAVKPRDSIFWVGTPGGNK